MTNETVSENERKRTQPSGAEAEGESAGAREESASKKPKLEQDGQAKAEDKRAEQPASNEGDVVKEQTEASIKEGDRKASPIKRGKGSGYSKRDHRGDTRGSGRERATADDGEGDAKTPRLPVSCFAGPGGSLPSHRHYRRNARCASLLATAALDTRACRCEWVQRVNAPRLLTVGARL